MLTNEQLIKVLKKLKRKKKMTRVQINKILKTNDNDLTHGGIITIYTLATPVDGKLSPVGLPENPSGADVFELCTSGQNFLFEQGNKSRVEKRANLALLTSVVAALAAVASVLITLL